MVPELDDPGETSQDGQHDEGEDQERLEQLGRVGQHRVEVHLGGRGAEEPLVSSRTEETVGKPQDPEVLEVTYCARLPNEPNPDLTPSQRAALVDSVLQPLTEM